MLVPICLTVALALTPNAAARADAARRQFDAGPAAFARALYTLEGCGTDALPVLRDGLFDDTRLPTHRYLLDAAVRAAGRDALPLLADVLRADHGYWHNLGLNIDDPAKVSADRLARLRTLLHHLHALGDRDADGLARDLRELFATHPIYRQAALDAGS